MLEIYTNSPRLIGNIDLNPEKSNSFEVAYMNMFGNIFFQLIAYTAVYENKIGRIKNSEGILTYENGSKFSANGIEVEFKYENPDLINGLLNYNYIIGDENDDTGDGHYNFKYIPQHNLTLGVAKNMGPLTVSTLFNYRSETEGGTEKLDSQNSMDFNVRYSHQLSSIHIQHALSVKNLTIN